MRPANLWKVRIWELGFRGCQGALLTVGLRGGPGGDRPWAKDAAGAMSMHSFEGGSWKGRRDDWARAAPELQDGGVELRRGPSPAASEGRRWSWAVTVAAAGGVVGRKKKGGRR